MGSFRGSVSSGSRGSTSRCVAPGTAECVDADTPLRPLTATSSACPRQCPIRDTQLGEVVGCCLLYTTRRERGRTQHLCSGLPQVSPCARNPSRLPALVLEAFTFAGVFAPKPCAFKTSEKQLWVVLGGMGVDRGWGAGREFGVNTGRALSCLCIPQHVLRRLPSGFKRCPPQEIVPLMLKPAWEKDSPGCRLSGPPSVHLLFQRLRGPWRDPVGSTLECVQPVCLRSRCSVFVRN